MWIILQELGNLLILTSVVLNKEKLFIPNYTEYLDKAQQNIRRIKENRKYVLTQF